MNYLLEMLGRRKTKEVRESIKSGKMILVTGDEKTGKTTLCEFLKSIGGNAVEDFDVCTITLKKPLNCITPNLLSCLERENAEKC